MLFSYNHTPLSNSYLSVSLLYHTLVNKSRHSLVYHPQLVAVYHQNGVLYIIKPQELYSIRASRNAMRDFVGVPYNARGAAIIETPRSALLQAATLSATKTMPRSQSNSEDFCIFNKMVHF